jgi:O-acetyl-ADP-ribose deacetylase
MKNIRVIQGDITKLKVDAIVNAANAQLTDGSGVNGAIQRAGGPLILEECRKIGGCPTGDAVITSGGRLPAKYVIHAVGPVWHGGHQHEGELLACAYHNSLKRAVENNISTLAFPNISTGIFGFPKELAAEIAVREVTAFLKDNTAIKEVIFCCYDEDNLKHYNKLI